MPSAPSSERVPTGIPGFDKLIEGGLIRGSNCLIAGQTGTGKSIFSMQYLLQGLENGESCLYISLEQKPEELIADMAKFSWYPKLKKYVELGKLSIVSSVPTSIEELRDVVISNVKRIGAKRFVLDSLTVAAMGWKVVSTDVGKIRSQVFDLLRILKNMDLTSLLVTEVPESDEKKLSRFEFEEFIADSVIVVRYITLGRAGNRTIEIRKMRRTKMDGGMHTLDIGKDGIKITD